MTTRRDFVKKAVAAGALVGLAPSMAAGSAGAAGAGESAADEPVDYYDKLGVAKIINAAGTYTYLTASVMPPVVQRAVAAAAHHPVRLAELQAAAGAYIAQKLQCEAALVSAGAASALSLAAAGCMTRRPPADRDDAANASGAADVPARTSQFKNEVIIQKQHLFPHTHGLEMAGTKLVEVNGLAEYEAAINDKTGMAFYLNAAEESPVSREDWVRVAKAHGVPTCIDAAADIPPISNLWNFTKMGFDLAVFSGGKGIRGPQNAGLLLGRADLIAAASANNVPHDRSIGRGMKVAKEQIVGMVAAVDWILTQTDEGLEAEARQRCETIARAVKTLPTVTTELFTPPLANHLPHLKVRYDQQRIPIKPVDVAEALRKGKPSIEINPGTGHDRGSYGLTSDANTILIGTGMLLPGEDVIVGRRLREVLGGALRAP